MSEFNPMTIAAAAEVIGRSMTGGDMEILEAQWAIAGECKGPGKSSRIAHWARLAAQDDMHVLTEAGRVSLARALVETAICAPEGARTGGRWRRLVAGLRFDGFEIVETQGEMAPDRAWRRGPATRSLRLVRMLPRDIPGLDFREAQSEIAVLLKRHGFAVAHGRLKRAVTAFGRGEWPAADDELQGFCEELIEAMTEGPGRGGDDHAEARRDLLGRLQPPVLSAGRIGGNADGRKPRHASGPADGPRARGGHSCHPGHADLAVQEEDAAFRLQTVLVTARLLLRRFDRGRA